ncbi:chromate efflux transporter [Actinocrinis puniceicyclus]|uniref:Chromate efflux transporter n=1 Tax=Actinocrinis puniceicyclus TaxID=977794 RepID=A0A8J7WPZ4_9ACTN|nr:chromate efflux transporter [Actinocrinis puniceicyclus]MBS2963767.1 chromate efflux transporter [Actinocrinis puniceicyclus]
MTDPQVPYAPAQAAGQDGAARPRVGLGEIAREWGRIGCIGFGGPPAHIALLRGLCVEQRGWLAADEFEDGIAATNLLPGPASTQLAIFCAWRLRRAPGAIVGGLCFIVPGLLLIIGLSALFLSEHAPLWVRGAAAGAGAAVAAVALNAAATLLPASRRRAHRPGQRRRWAGYLGLGAAAAILIGPYLVLVLVACGGAEALWRRRAAPGAQVSLWPLAAAAAAPSGVLGALAWTAFKVGALSYGGGFVIIPLMQADAVHRYHFLTAGQFTAAVALGQITPGPVVQTVAVVGYGAAGALGALLAAAVAFSPSFLLVLFGAGRFDRLRGSQTVQAFLDGAGPATIGAIGGSAFTLGLALAEPWQFAVLAAAGLWLLVLRRGVVSALLGAGALGVVAALVGLALS